MTQRSKFLAALTVLVAGCLAWLLLGELDPGLGVAVPLAESRVVVVPDAGPMPLDGEESPQQVVRETVAAPIATQAVEGRQAGVTDWWGRVLAPGRNVEGVRGVDVGVAYWRVAARQPFPSSAAWLAMGRSDGEGFVHLMLPPIPPNRAPNLEVLIEHAQVGFARVSLDWHAHSRTAAQSIHLVPSAGATIHVLGPDDEPLAGLMVVLEGLMMTVEAPGAALGKGRSWKSDRRWQAETDRAGVARFGTLPTGLSLGLRVTEGKRVLHHMENAIWAQAGEELIQTVKLIGTQGGTIKGRVHRRDGEPVAHLKVQAFPRSLIQDSSNSLSGPKQAGVPCLATTETDEEGRFELSEVPGGHILVSLRDEGGSGALAWRGLVLGRDRPSVELDFTVGGRRKIQGRVVGPDGKPVVGAGLSLSADPERGARYGRGFGFHALVWSGKDGSFRFQGVPPGPMLLDLISDAGYLEQPLRLTAASHNLKLQLIAGGRISGHVIPAPGGAFSYAKHSLRVFDAAGAAIESNAWVKGDRFGVGGLRDGVYSLVLTTRSGGRAPTHWRDRLDRVVVGAGIDIEEQELLPVQVGRGNLTILRRGRGGEVSFELLQDGLWQAAVARLGQRGGWESSVTSGLWTVNWSTAEGQGGSDSVFVRAGKTELVWVGAR